MEGLVPRGGARVSLVDSSPSRHQGDAKHGQKLRHIDTQTERLQAQSCQMCQKSEEQNRTLEDELNKLSRVVEKQEDVYQQYEEERERDIQALKDKLTLLTDQNRQLERLVVARQGSALQAMVSSKGCAPMEDRLIHDELSKLAGNIRSWSKRHCAASPNTLQNIPREDKDAIIRGLGEYCNEHDWDSLMQKIPVSSGKVQAILVQALLSRLVFETLFADCFFALTRIGDDGTTPERAEMVKVYKAMRQGEKQKHRR